MSNLSADKVLRVNCPGFGVSSTLPLGEAKPLAMYDVIVINPTSIVHLFEPKSDVGRQIDKILAEGGSTLKLDSDSTLESISAELELREHELRQFLSKGGLLIYFLAPPFLLQGPEQSMDNYIWLYEWSPDKNEGERAMVANRGRGAEMTARGKHHPFGPYMQQLGLEWSTVIRTENLSEGYNAIALAGQGKAVAGYKSSGPRRGQVLFLPAPYDARYDETLRDCIMRWYEIHTGPEADQPEPDYEEAVKDFDSGPDVEGEAFMNDLFSDEAPAAKKKSSIDWPEFDNDVPPFSREKMADDLDAKLDAFDPHGCKAFSREDLQQSSPEPSGGKPPISDEDLDMAFDALLEGKSKAQPAETTADDLFSDSKPKSQTHDDLFEEDLFAERKPKVEQPSRADERFEQEIKRPQPQEEAFEQPVPRSEPERFEQEIRKPQPQDDDMFEERKPRVEPASRYEQESRRPQPQEDIFEDRVPQIEKPRVEERFEQEIKRPQPRDEEFDFDLALEAKPKRAAEPAPASLEVHAANVSIPEAKDLMSRMEQELSVPGGAPDWCGRVSFSELSDMQQQLDHLNETVRKAKIKIADIEERIRKLGEIKDALLSASGHKLQRACSQVFELLGWHTEPSLDESKELYLKDGDKVQAIVRIVYTTGQPNRTELAELSQSVIAYWDRTDIEPKGILLASTFADRHPRERDGEDFTTSIQEFARRKNLCLVNALQVLAIYREVALRDGDANRIREAMLTTNGLINGFRLQFSEPAAARS